MFVFGSAANVSVDGGDGGAAASEEGVPSFTFDASFLPAVDSDAAAGGAAGGGRGFELDVPLSLNPAITATEGGEGREAGDISPLFGSTFKNRGGRLGLA